MIRIAKLSGTYYGCELPDDNEDAMDEIEIFVNDGIPVIVVESVDDLRDLGIDDPVEMVERE